TCPATSAGKVALVLPGGGVKGMAHVGVIKMLDSLGIVPDIVVGTSMGAIVGGMYASGYSGAEIERLTRQFNIGAYIGRYAPRAPRAFAISGASGASLLGSQLPGEPTPLMLLRQEEGTFAVATSLADEGSINLFLTALLVRGDLIGRGSFDSLPIPFRAVATDLHSGARVALDHGDLAQAIRASVAIPFVFEPVTIDGRQLVDGGLSENVPVRLARELGAKRVILSTLEGSGTGDSTSRGAAAGGTIDLLIDRIFLDAHPPLGSGDVEVSTNVSDIPNLDFSAAVVARLIDRGAAAARTIQPSSCLPRRVRDEHALPPVSSAIVTRNAVPGASELLRSAVRPTESRLAGWLRRSSASPTRDTAPLVLDSVQARLARAGTSGILRALWLSPLRATGDSVAFNPIIRWADQRTIGVGGAYDNDLGAQAWIAIANRHAILHRGFPALESGGRLTLGTRRQEGFISLRRSDTDVRYSVSPFALLMVARENEPFFVESPSSPPAKVDLPTVLEQLLQLGVDVPVSPMWTVQTGPLIRRWHGGLTDSARTATRMGVGLRVDHGDETRRQFGRLDLEWNQRYRRASGRFSLLTNTSVARFTSTIRAGATSVEAPYSAWFLLGGTEGFPGLNVRESIGTSTASYMLDAARHLYGPLNTQVTGMTGTVSRNADRAFGGTWLFGARVGIGADSPIGPIRLQYGLSTTGRRQWFARIGRWI
ncbi:MAG TPA: patatin-like phospholipase family protein, partial [Gemmatimonadaceae bacterium]|nr:patatin-like phospholipase family protein [Gemmatimonadaceae bacterium]